MQTQPAITATPIAAIASQTAAAPDNDTAAQPAESFGNVLARQRAQTAQDKSAPPKEGKQQAAPADAQSAEDAAAATALPGAPSALPGDMLAALLPATTTGNTDSSRNDAQPTAADGSNSLPADMLTLLAPAAAHKAILEQKPQGTQQEATGRKEQPDMIAALGTAAPVAAHGSTQGAPEAAATALAANVRKEDLPQGVSASTHGKEILKPEAGGKEKPFAAELERLGKDGEATSLSAAPLTKASSQSEESAAANAMNAMMQSVTASSAATQNGAAQAVQATINTPVTHEAWGEEFGQKITWMATQHDQTAELHLNPPNLGPLDVVLNVSGDQATALFTSPHAAVRDAVEQALPKLRDMLADNGITLGNAMVSDQSPQERQAWQAEQDKRNGSGRSVDTVAADAPATRISTLQRHQGLVDTFA